MQCKLPVRHKINRISIEITLLPFEDFFWEGVPYLRWEDGIHFTPPTELCGLPSISCCPTSVSSAAAAFRFIVILLPDPAYITEYIEDPFDTVRMAGDSMQYINKFYTIKLVNYFFLFSFINMINMQINYIIYESHMLSTSNNFWNMCFIKKF